MFRRSVFSVLFTFGFIIDLNAQWKNDLRFMDWYKENDGLFLYVQGDTIFNRNLVYIDSINIPYDSINYAKQINKKYDERIEDERKFAQQNNTSSGSWNHLPLYKIDTSFIVKGVEEIYFLPIGIFAHWHKCYDNRIRVLTKKNKWKTIIKCPRNMLLHHIVSYKNKYLLIVFELNQGKDCTGESKRYWGRIDITKFLNKGD